MKLYMKFTILILIMIASIIVPAFVTLESALLNFLIFPFPIIVGLILGIIIFIRDSKK